METSTLTLLTIIVDEALKRSIEEDISNFGAKGYTLTYVEGKGTTGERDNAWVGENVKIETIVSQEAIEKILDYLSEKYFDKYPIIAYTHAINVVRPSHFK